MVVEVEKLKNKNVNSLLVFFLTFCYLEILFKIIMHYPLFSLNLINNILYMLFLTIVCKFLTSCFKRKINMGIFYFLLSFFCLFYAVQVVVHNIFGFAFDFSLLGATDQIMRFTGDMFKLIFRNILYILVIFLPVILSAIFHKHIDCEQIVFKKGILLLPLAAVFYFLFMASLLIGKNKDNSAYNLYYNSHNVEISLKNLGVINTMFIDFERFVFGFSGDIEILPTDTTMDTGKNEEETKYEANNLDIDFESLINNSNGTIKTMHQYFQNETGSFKNEYTGMFKDKNLIMFMAESFNEIAVSKELTPTLYKLVNNGFVFKNFYTPTISSTIGGEFQELTGLVAASGFLTPWKNGKNTFPYGLGTMFKNAGFATFAFHDNSYTFQSRNKYLPSLGFTNFKACGNGLESKMNCKRWPESDVEMFKATFDDYINTEGKFMVFYATVSGHGDYVWSGNAMSTKHKDEVANLKVSEKPKAYVAAQIELDKALELLLQKLEDAGKLDDTVIALVGDHYPYYLSEAEVNELASYKKDSVVEINHSNFILWNNKMDKVEVDKVGSQIDVLPTIYNLFGLPYDSRVIIGKDILSTTPGLAIFGNQSWVSDYGTYFAAQSEFVPKKGKEVDDNYVSDMNKKVASKVNMSKLILTEDYYKYIK